jgi:hypothetical protein
MGISRTRRSRIAPPPAAVKAASTTTLHAFNPAAAPAEAPIMAKTANPSASTTRKARSSSRNLLPFATKCHAIAARQPTREKMAYRFVVKETGIR